MRKFLNKRVEIEGVIKVCTVCRSHEFSWRQRANSNIPYCNKTLLEKSTEGSKAYAINNDDNEDKMNFRRAVTLPSGRMVKAKSKVF